MAEKIYKTETVEQGNKANWPNQSDGMEPMRKGCLFNSSEIHISMPYNDELCYYPKVIINFYQTES